jgi:hypothetical protein
MCLIVISAIKRIDDRRDFDRFEGRSYKNKKDRETSKAEKFIEEPKRRSRYFFKNFTLYPNFL